MSVRRLADEQPTSFEFTPENEAWAKKELAKYPPGRQASAVLALLWRAQKQSGYWLPRPAIEAVAAMLEMPNIRVLEVATFYTMFNLAPVGRHYVQLCGTTPCMLCGAEDLKAVCRKRIGEQGHVTSDGLFSWTEVECLGACCNAPMVQINDDYYEDLTPESFAKLLDDLAAGRPVRTGSQVGRVSSEPVGGLTSLTSSMAPTVMARLALPRPRTMSRRLPWTRPLHTRMRKRKPRTSRRRLRPCRRTRRLSRRRTRSASRPLALEAPRGRRPGRPAADQGRGSGQREAPARAWRLSLRTDRRLGEGARFAGSQPICRFPAASIVSNGWSRPPGLPPVKADPRTSKPTPICRPGRSGTERCWKTRIASSPISTGSATAA